VSPTGSGIPTKLPGQSGVPTVLWGGPGINLNATAGPIVQASINGTGGGSSVFLGNGGSFVKQRDFFLPLNGIDWSHERAYSSEGSSIPSEWAGEGWWTSEMINITGTAGDEDDNDCDVQLDPNYTLTFNNTATATWTTNYNYLYTLTYSSGEDEFTLTRADGFKYVFHDLNVADVSGRLKTIEDPYGNDWAFTYSGSDLDYIVVDVVEGTDHKITYTYFESGDNDGLLQYIKVYKSTTVQDSDLIGQIEHVYHDSTVDTYGLEDDLMKVIVSRKATSDGDGTLSMSESYFYRYYKGTWDTDTNPGTDHQLRYVLLPENADRLNTDKGDPLTQSNSDWEDYANIMYEYGSGSDQVRLTDERMPGTGCGCGGGSPATTTYTWTTNLSPSGLNTWALHCVAGRNDSSEVVFDVNTAYQILSWSVENAGETRKVIWHFDYGTSGATENRLTSIHYPSNCTAYSSSSPYGVTVASSAGVVYVIDYDYSTSTYDGYPEKYQIKQGDRGTANTLIAYGRTESTRPDLATSRIEYESTGESDDRTTTLAYSFYDSGGAKVQTKQITVTHPSVSSAKNGPGASAVDYYFLDKRTGALRWSKDGEGYVRFFAYDDETGVRDLSVADANTSTLMAVIDSNWDGINHGGLTNDDDVPTDLQRSGSGTALDIDSASVIDWLGRTRKTTDPEGMITYVVYKDDETRVYPAWDTSTEKTLLPIRITNTNKDGRAEEAVTLDTDFDPNVTSNEPNGTTSYSNTDMVTRTVNSYGMSGMLEHTDRYHTIPASGDGTRYTNFYRVSYEYDDMGRREYVISDVADESTYDREQVTGTVYDYLGRVEKVSEGVSDSTHDISAGKPTLVKTTEMYYDDPDTDSTPERGDGDGNLSWVSRYYGSGGSDHNDTFYNYDWRNRRCVTVAPTAPHSLITYDHLGRVTASGQYISSTNLDPGDDAATEDYSNRFTLSKTYYDERGRVYKSERYDDAGDSTPADELASNTYRDRRGLVWATDPANSGISFTKYDGAGRRIQTSKATQFDAATYTSNAPDYPDDDEYIFQLTDFTLDEAGQVTKVVTKELNHNDTDGMDVTNNDDYVQTFIYNWHDDAHRLTDTANYGTNDADWEYQGTAPTYGASAPARSDTILVTSYSYDSAGRRYLVTDPKNISTRSVFNDMGQMTSKEEADGTADERITNYAYNALGSLITITADLTTDQVTGYVYEDAQNARWVTKIKYPDPSTGAASDTAANRIVFTYNADGTLATRTDQNGTVLTWTYDTLRRKTEEEVTTLGTYTGGAAAVDGAVRAVTWSYNTKGQTEYVTTHSDTTPDTSTYTDAVNQVKYTFDSAGKRTKEETEYNGKVDGSTLAVEFSYATDYSTGNYNRLEYIEYPDDRKVWYGYTNSGGANTFQDTINDKFNRIGQIAEDNSGSIGDILTEYEFNGMGRMVRRVNDEVSGANGNQTRMDLWHSTSGTYAGFDRFGRAVDLKQTEFGGTATDFERREYGYDRNSNREYIKNSLYKAESYELTYDNLNRLTVAEQGILDSSNEVEQSDVKLTYDMDLLGNLTAGAGGLKVNGTSSTVTHAVNATNEITTLGHPNQAGQAAVISDDFTTSLSSFWTEDTGDWSISSDWLNVDTLAGGQAILLADSELEMEYYQVDVKFPAASSTSTAGLIFSHDGDNDYYRVVLDRTNNKVVLHKIVNGSSTNPNGLASESLTISQLTTYRIIVTRKRGFVEVTVTAAGIGEVSFTCSSNTGFGSGLSGLYSDKTDVTFDNLTAKPAPTRAPMVPGIVGLADTSIDHSELYVQGGFEGGTAIIDRFGDDDYMVQVDVELNSGAFADVYFRYIDVNNTYRVRIDENGDVELGKFVDGDYTSLDTDTYTTASSVAVKAKCDGTTLEAWVAGTLKVTDTDSDLAAGAVALGGESPKFDDLKVGYDVNDDDDIDDAGDNLVVDEAFGSTDVTVSHCDAGNLIDDGCRVFIYDAWNRLVEVRSSEDADVVFQTASFDGLGRRIKKVVTNSGDLDGTTVYYYRGHQIIETRDGSDNMVAQFIHGTRYIDELVMMRAADKGDLYYHQDANWNVIALTDQGGSVVERYLYKPYGQMTVHQVTSFGDRDGDGDVDATDKGTPGTDCTGTVSGACRILDLDFDGDYDAADATLFDSLPQGNAQKPGRTASSIGNPFAHQGLPYDAEIGSYQNRARQYNAGLRRFMQRDPLALRKRRFDATREYLDGMSSYQYLRANPAAKLDALGLACGSGWTDSIVPDNPSLPYSPCPSVPFTGPCLVHDACYETCGMRKDFCDETFWDNLIRVCNYVYPSCWHPCRYQCLALTGIYYYAVKRLGQAAYDEAQEGAGC